MLVKNLKLGSLYTITSTPIQYKAIFEYVGFKQCQYPLNGTYNFKMILNIRGNWPLKMFLATNSVRDNVEPLTNEEKLEYL
jgi:hypothetical protein